MQSTEDGAKIRRELFTVLFLGVLPMILIGAFLFKPSIEEPPPPCYIPGLSGTVTGVLMGLTYLSFFVTPAVAIYRSGLPLSHFGICWRGRDDIWWGLGGFLTNYVTGWLLWWAFRATGFPLGVENIAAFHYVHAGSVSELVATWPWYVLVIIAEEQMARCYLITRIRDVTGSEVKAVLFSSLLFASWHTFWGAAGVAHVLKAGLVFGFMFSVRRGVGSVAIAHFIFDGLSLLPR
jgi:membrane protease YdiL (CAAX protease family)